jgi:hypothetical protein
LTEPRRRVRIISGAVQQILDHRDLLNEDVVINAVLSTPVRKRVYYTSERFSILIRRKSGSGAWKSILIRVEQELAADPTIQNQGEENYVVLLIHVESDD